MHHDHPSDTVRAVQNVRNNRMGLAKQSPKFAAPTDYEDDFYLWCHEQAELLRHKRFAELDLPNIIEELESMGRSDRNALSSSYRVLMLHLLKWQFQPSKRSKSWLVTILRERGNIEEQEKRNPSLKAEAADVVVNAYRRARREAALETGLKIERLPIECPYTLEQLRDDDWMPA